MSVQNITSLLPRGYTEAEAADMLSTAGWSVSARTLRRDRERGLITFRTVGGKVRYTEADLLDYLNRGTQWAKAESSSGTSSSKDTGSEKSEGPTPIMPIGTTEKDARLAGSLLMSVISSGHKSP